MRTSLTGYNALVVGVVVVVPDRVLVLPEPLVVPLDPVVVLVPVDVGAGAFFNWRTAWPRLKPSTVIAFCRSANATP